MEKKKIINDTNIIGVNIQIIVTVLALIFGILTIFNNSFSPWFRILVGLDLFVMAYNNHKIHHKKNLTIIYIVFAVLIILVGILSLFGVI